MPLLTAADITAMRATLNQSLPGTAVIYSRSYVSDSGGGGTMSFTAAGTVAARIAPLTALEEVTGDRLAPEANWVVTLPAETTISEDSQVVIGGGTFTVEAVRGPRSFELSRRVEVSKVV